jgi:hypothetical protein
MKQKPAWLTGIPEPEPSTCPLCSRPLGSQNIDEHHLVPKTFKGTETSTMHRICHRKIHATFTERELLNYYHTAERLLENEEIQKFVTWVSKKPPEFYDGSKETTERRGKRRR